MVKLVITIMKVLSQSGLEFWWIIAPAADSRDSGYKDVCDERFLLCLACISWVLSYNAIIQSINNFKFLKKSQVDASKLLKKLIREISRTIVCLMEFINRFLNKHSESCSKHKKYQICRLKSASKVGSIVVTMMWKTCTVLMRHIKWTIIASH